MPSEYVARWRGGRIGAGASVFHFTGTNSPTTAQSLANAVRQFFVAAAPLIGSGIAIEFDAEVRVLDNNGTLTAVLPVTRPTILSGSGGNDFINGTGGMVRWTTSSIVAGRRLLGRTFIVPMESASFVSGEMTASAQGTLAAAGAALITASQSASAPLVVWSRANAVTAEVINCTVPSRPSSLRTRNDRD